MTGVVLAAGYATRMYPLTRDFPKPLLPVGGRTILDRLMDDVDSLEQVSGTVIVTNGRFEPMFRSWLGSRNFRHGVSILSDGTSDEASRLGAVGDLMLALDALSMDDDILVMAADNLLSFSLGGFCSFALERGCSAVMCHREENPDRLRRTGVAEIDAGMRVIRIQEKPSEPCSTWAVPPFYIYLREHLRSLRDCVREGCATDSPGSLASAMCLRVPVGAYEMPAGRVDVGDVGTYMRIKDTEL